MSSKQPPNRPTRAKKNTKPKPKPKPEVIEVAADANYAEPKAGRPKQKPALKIKPEPEVNDFEGIEDDDLKDLLGNAFHPRSVGRMVKCGFLHRQRGESQEWDWQYFFLYSHGRLHSSSSVLQPPSRKGIYLMVESWEDMGAVEKPWHEFILRGTLRPGCGVLVEHTFRCSEDDYKAWKEFIPEVVDGVCRKREKELAHKIVSMEHFNLKEKPYNRVNHRNPGNYFACWPYFDEDKRG